jgi:hypothetical protein
MSERVDKLIAKENEQILNLLHNDEAVYVHAYYYLDDNGKRVYDVETMRDEFEENMYNLIDLNQQKGLSDGKVINNN